MTNSIRAAVAVAVLTCLGPPARAAADPTLLALADPDVNFVVGIDVRGLAASPLIRKMLAEGEKKKPELSMLFEALGANPAEKLEEILIVGRADPGDDAREGLILARGDFSDPALVAALCQNGCETSDYRGFQLHRTVVDGEPGAFVKLDDRYAALGKPDQVRGVVDRRAASASSSLAGDLQGWGSDLSGNQLWLAARGPFEVPAAGAPPGLAAAAEGVEAVAFGLTVSGDAELSLAVRAQNAGKAQQLHDLAQGLLLIVAAGADSNPETVKVLRGLSMEVRGDSVLASLHVPEASLAQAFHATQTASSQPSKSAGAAPPAASREPKQKQGVIRVYGLEDEPVEFKDGGNSAP